MNDNLGEIDTRRRRLLWRAMHRGMRELDLLLGGFAQMRLRGMNDGELHEFEAIVACADTELYDWLLGGVPVPQEQRTTTMTALLAYHPPRGDHAGA